MAAPDLSLEHLMAGDIFHAGSSNGANLICLVISLTENSIVARTITSQLNFIFDRKTGIAEWGENRVRCTIDSTLPLPVELHNIMLGLDRKYRLVRDLERVALTDTEKSALLYTRTHYPPKPREQIVNLVAARDGPDVEHIMSHFLIPG